MGDNVLVEIDSGGLEMPGLDPTRHAHDQERSRKKKKKKK